jgi:hypothetical protein
VDEHLGDCECFWPGYCISVPDAAAWQAYKQRTASLGLYALSRASGHFLALNEPWPTRQFVLHNFTISQDVVATDFPDANVHPLFYVGVYCAIGVAAAFVAIVSQWILFTGGLRGGECHTNVPGFHLLLIKGTAY